MSMDKIALDLLGSAIKIAPVLIESIFGLSAETLAERIANARANIKDPIDTSGEDTARRAELDRILRGEE